MRTQVTEYLRQLGEPAHYLPVHAAALEGLAQANLLVQPGRALPASRAAPEFQTRWLHASGSASRLPADTLHQVETTIEAALTQGGHFARYAGSSRSLETGHWWLDEASIPAAEIAEPLADRLEVALVRYLQERSEIQLHEVDRALCREFPGLLTPELEMVQQCLASYAEHVTTEVLFPLDQGDPPRFLNHRKA